MTPSSETAAAGGRLLALADRIEAASAPDRVLDAEIAVALKIGARGLLDDDHEYLSPVRKDDGCAPGTYWFNCRSGKSLRTASEFTGSVDAALTTKDAEWLLDVEQEFDVLTWAVELWLVGDAEASKSAVARCQSLPSAIVVASLRAKAAALAADSVQP